MPMRGKRSQYCLLACLIMMIGMGGCAGSEGKADQKANDPPVSSVWDQRIGTAGVGVHAARIGAASIDTLVLGGPASSPKIADHLADPSAEVRAKAVKALAKFGKKAEPALPKIIGFLRQQDPAIRAAAAQALALIAHPAGRDALNSARRDNSAAVRVWAHAGLEKVEGDCEDHQEEIAELLASGKLAKPMEAAQAIRSMPCAGEDAIKELIEALAGNNESITAAAASALGSMGAKAESAVPALLKGLDRDSFRVRQSCLLALSKMGAKAAPAVPRLIEILADRAPRFRELAAHALGEIGPAAARAEGVLQKATRDQEAPVQAAAKRALAKIIKKP